MKQTSAGLMLSSSDIIFRETYNLPPVVCSYHNLVKTFSIAIFYPLKCGLKTKLSGFQGPSKLMIFHFVDKLSITTSPRGLAQSQISPTKLLNYYILTPKCLDFNRIIKDTIQNNMF